MAACVDRERGERCACTKVIINPVFPQRMEVCGSGLHRRGPMEDEDTFDFSKEVGKVRDESQCVEFHLLPGQSSVPFCLL